MPKGLFFKALALGCSLYLSGCTSLQNFFILEDVKPWEKDILAQDEMAIRGDSMEIYVDDHIYFSKEASNGGYGVGGGGCGCN